MNEFHSGGAVRDGTHEHRSYLLAEITRQIIQLHKQYFGKGPTKGRTYWQEDVITVLLRGGFTPAEHTLHETGHAEAVSEQRTKMHDGLREHFTREISELTGRQVIGYMNGIQQDPDMAVEVFVLAPESDERDSLAGTRENNAAQAHCVDSGAVRTRAAEQRRLAVAQRERAIRERADHIHESRAASG